MPQPPPTPQGVDASLERFATRAEQLAEAHARLQAEIEQRRAVEDSLRQTQAVLELALSAANVSLWRWNLGTNEPWVSPQFWRALGCDPETNRISFDLWVTMLHPDDRPRVLSLLERYFANPWPDYRNEFRLRRADGSYAWFLAVGGVVEADEQGRPVVMTGCSVDITERRQLEERVRQRESELAHFARLHVLGELVAGLAQELERPLGAIVNDAERCRADLSAATPAGKQASRQGLRKIAADAHHSADIVRRLRRMVRKAPSEQATFELARTLEEAAELIAYQTRLDGIELRLCVPADLRPLAGDAVQIEQVVLNLLHNAVDAVRRMPSGRRRIDLIVRDTETAVSIECHDSGAGIDPQVLPRLFDAFSSKKRGGLGIGLAVSRTIIEAHGGRLICKSHRPGRTVFCIELPRCEAAESARGVSQAAIR